MWHAFIIIILLLFQYVHVSHTYLTLKQQMQYTHMAIDIRLKPNMYVSHYADYSSNMDNILIYFTSTSQTSSLFARMYMVCSLATSFTACCAVQLYDDDAVGTVSRGNPTNSMIRVLWCTVHEACQKILITPISATQIWCIYYITIKKGRIQYQVKRLWESRDCGESCSMLPLLES